MFRFFLVAAILLLSEVTAFHLKHVIPERFTHGRLFHSLIKREADISSQHLEYVNKTNSVFCQLVNHSSPDGPFFNQRYWVDYSAWEGGDMAMLYIPGEAPGMTSPGGFPGIYGHQRHMLLFTLENRYYGESLPAPLTDKEKLKKYLSVDIALDDLRSFQRYVEETLVGRKFRWLVVGGSYAGALSVWFKIKYPTAALAVWSSSGVVEPQLNFYAYDNHVKAEIPPSCAQSVRNVQSLFLTIWENKISREAFLDRFSLPHYLNKAEISYMLADFVAAAVQYGEKWEMCEMITPQNKTDPIEQFMNMIINMFGPLSNSYCTYSTECLSNVSFSEKWIAADYVWIYQTCSELAYFQVSYYNSLRLSDINLNFFIHQCRSIFGYSIFPDIYKFNIKWGGKKPNISNVIALQASDDPWSEVGVGKTLRSNYPVVMANCEGCGHCGDLYNPKETDSLSLKEQRIQIIKYLDIWMTSKSTLYNLIIYGNFNKKFDIKNEELIKAIQKDISNNFDNSTEVLSLSIDYVKKVLNINLTAYVNSMNQKDLMIAQINMRKDSSWLFATQRLFSLLGIKDKLIVLSFEEVEISIENIQEEITNYVEYFLYGIILFLPIVWVFSIVLRICYKYRENKTKQMDINTQ